MTPNLFAADVVKEAATAPVSTNSSATPYLLSTNRSSFFCANNLTSSAYVKFSPDGFYEVTQREHMGVMSWDAGRWTQDTNGLVILKSNTKKANEPTEQKVLVATTDRRRNQPLPKEPLQ